MIKEELKECGYYPLSARVGIIWLKNPFVGILKDDVFELYNEENDMIVLAKCKTKKDLLEAENTHYLQKINATKTIIAEYQSYIQENNKKIKSYENS